MCIKRSGWKTWTEEITEEAVDERIILKCRTVVNIVMKLWVPQKVSWVTTGFSRIRQQQRILCYIKPNATLCCCYSKTVRSPLSPLSRPITPPRRIQQVETSSRMSVNRYDSRAFPQSKQRREGAFVKSSTLTIWQLLCVPSSVQSTEEENDVRRETTFRLTTPENRKYRLCRKLHSLSLISSVLLTIRIVCAVLINVTAKGYL